MTPPCFLHGRAGPPGWWWASPSQSRSGDVDEPEVKLTPRRHPNVLDPVGPAVVARRGPQRDGRHLLRDQLLGIAVQLVRLVQGERLVRLGELRVHSRVG